MMANLSSAAEPATLVFIHGAWGGAHHWKPVADRLTERGHETHRVALTGLGERSHLLSPGVTLDTHVADAVNLIRFNDLRGVTLIGHSYGGVVAQGVVEAIPDRVDRVLCLDSHLLEDGEAYLTHHPEKLAHYTRRAEEAGDGWRVPVDWPNPFQDTPHPLATLTQPLRLTQPKPAGVATAYWLFADGEPAEEDDRYRYLERARAIGWSARAFDWDHNPQRSRPDELTAELQRFLE